MFVLVSTLFYLYIRNNKSRLKYISLLLRLMIIFFIILFISDFNIIYNRTDKISSELNIFIDNSLSSKEINNSNDYLTTIIKSIDNYQDSINNKINYYSFGSHLRLIDNFNQINLDEKSTDISEVIKLINNSMGSNNVIITDGNLNSGVEVSRDIIADKNRLFVIATSEIEDFDIRIDNFRYQKNFFSNDSISISFDIISNLPEKHNAKIFINSSQFLNNHLEIGKKVTSFKKQISTDLFINGINRIEIGSFSDEKNIENNKITFSYIESKQTVDVALLSGKISKNTSTIKNILKSFPNLKLQHIYRLSDDESISAIGLLNNEIDLFIFDNFPYSNDDLLIADKIIDKQSKIVFFDSNDISEKAIAFFQKIPNLEIVKNIEGQRFKNIDSKRFNVPSQYRSYNWYKNEESLISYNDYSIAVDQYNNLLLVLITDLNKLYLNKNISSDINYFYSYLNDIIKNDFYYEKKKFQISDYRERYFLNEFVNISIIYDNIYNNQIINIEVKKNNVSCR